MSFDWATSTTSYRRGRRSIASHQSQCCPPHAQEPLCSPARLLFLADALTLFPPTTTRSSTPRMLQSKSQISPRPMSCQSRTHSPHGPCRRALRRGKRRELHRHQTDRASGPAVKTQERRPCLVQDSNRPLWSSRCVDLASFKASQYFLEIFLDWQLCRSFNRYPESVPNPESTWWATLVRVTEWPQEPSIDDKSKRSSATLILSYCSICCINAVIQILYADTLSSQHQRPPSNLSTSSQWDGYTSVLLNVTEAVDLLATQRFTSTLTSHKSALAHTVVFHM